MRAVRLLPWLLLPMLAACGGGNAPAPSSSQNTTQAPAASTEVQQSADQTQQAANSGNDNTQVAQTQDSAPAKPTVLPASARPMIGTWSADLSQCDNASAETVVSAAKFEGPGRSCVMSLKDNGDGTFALACGKESIKMTPVFTPTGEGITLAYGDGSKETLLRCGQ